MLSIVYLVVRLPKIFVLLKHQTFFCLCLLLLFSSCARNFSTPDLTALSYSPAGSTSDKLDFDLTQEPLVLEEPFAKKLDKRDIQLHVLRVSNTTPDTVWLRTQEVQLIANSKPLEVIAPRKVYKALKQPVAVHALWLLIGPFVRTEDDGVRRLDYHPFGAAFAAWGIRNGIVAYGANREVKRLLRITVPAGDTPLPPNATFYMLLPLPQDATDANLRLLYTEEVTPLPSPAPTEKKGN